MRVDDPSQVTQAAAARASSGRAPAPTAALSFDAQLEHAARRAGARTGTTMTDTVRAPVASSAPSFDARLEHAARRPGRTGGTTAPAPAAEAPTGGAPAPAGSGNQRPARPALTAEQRESAEIRRRHDIKGPKDETYARVPGRPRFVEITSGPRNGMFVNVSGNERDGQAFVRVRSGHHMLHIYGKGEDRVVIPVRRPASEYKPAPDAPKNETYADVPNHWEYDEIVSGPRNGMFINRSGNERDGMAFVRVARGDRVFHVYGTGRDRLWVEVHGHWKPAPEVPMARVSRPG